MALCCCVEATGIWRGIRRRARGRSRTSDLPVPAVASELRRLSHHLFDEMRTIAAASEKDHFSDLTDDLLWHVLSFLPSDDALQTCVLDTRWRDLWRRTTSLHFNVQDCERFRRLVKLIVQLRGKSPLAKCEIITCPEDYTLNANWLYTNTKLLIEFALECQVKELILTPMHFEDIDPPIFDVPFISQYLKTIDLCWVNLECSALNFLGCPILEELKMYHCSIYAWKISSKSLKRLCITDFCTIPQDFRIRIFAPYLISLQVDDFDGATPFLGNMPFLVTAYVGLGYACQDCCYWTHLRGCSCHCSGCHIYPAEGGVLLNGLSNAVNLELILTNYYPANFLYKWDLEWCPIFSKLKTLVLNEWFTAIDLICILQHSPILEMLTLQLHNTKNLTGATGAQETIEQSFVCAHLKVVNIECGEVDEGIHKILNILRTCGILRDHISIKARSSPSSCFSFQKPLITTTVAPAAPTIDAS